MVSSFWFSTDLHELVSSGYQTPQFTHNLGCYLLAWLAMIQRWDAYKRVVHFRLREIEQDLGLWHNRYLEHLSVNKKIVKCRDLSVTSEDDRARLQRLEQAFPDYPGTAVISFIKLTTLGLILGWVGVIIIEFIFTFVQ